MESGAPPEAKARDGDTVATVATARVQIWKSRQRWTTLGKVRAIARAILAGSSSLPGLALSLTSLCPGAGFLAGKWPVFSRLTPCRPLIHGKDYRSLLGPQPTLALLAQRSQSPEDPPHRNQR